MKLKYYLRGLGIGMAVTAVILHFSVYTSVPVLTNEEIMERARQLGMIERITLSENESLAANDDLTSGIEDDGTDIAAASNDGQDAEDQSNSGEPDNGDGQEGNLSDNPSEDSSEDPSQENVEDEDPSVNPADEDYVPGDGQDEDIEGGGTEEQSEGMGGAEEMGDSIVITVVGGDSSVSVAAKLAQAGLVSSGAAYDDYLCANGYDKRICTGNHVIPIGASEREIAEIITTRH